MGATHLSPDCLRAIDECNKAFWQTFLPGVPEAGN